MAESVSAKPLLAAGACARGELLRLTEPLSFWGGVDPKTGNIIQVRHAQAGQCIAGKVLALPGTIGSSSSSAVLLELIRVGRAPAALLMAEPDAILLIACLAAREMDWPAPPAFKLPAARQMRLAAGNFTISKTGLLSRAT